MESFKEWVSLLAQMAAFFGGFGGFLVGLAALFNIVHPPQPPPKEPEESHEQGEKPVTKRRVRRRPFWLILLILCLCIVVLSGNKLRERIAGIMAGPANVQLTKQSLDAFNRKMYAKAVQKADECISQFREQAFREQEKLEENNAVQPVDDKDKTKRFGVLNDVATCYLIKGHALKEHNQKSDSVLAYEEAAELTYAQSRDPKNTSLFAAQAAEEYLKDLLSVNERLTRAAWRALNRGQYDEAVSKADECINQFAGQAFLEQAKLETLGAPQFPEGKVADETAQQIHANGLLNDVATCHFIKGCALEERHHYPESRAAYEEATKFTYARTWDPRSFLFWIPSQAAKGRLITLPTEPKQPAPNSS
jgi:tetratricopeptide (TPR) repeat protein